MKFLDSTKIPSHSLIIHYNFSTSLEQVKLYRDDCSMTRTISRLLHNDKRSIERQTGDNNNYHWYHPGTSDLYPNLEEKFVVIQNCQRIL